MNSHKTCDIEITENNEITSQIPFWRFNNNTDSNLRSEGDDFDPLLIPNLIG